MAKTKTIIMRPLRSLSNISYEHLFSNFFKSLIAHIYFIYEQLTIHKNYQKIYPYMISPKLRRGLILIILFLFCTAKVQAYWVWTPQSKKWTNPKYSSKDIPKDQFDWGLDFFDRGKYKRAVKEFNKLIKRFPRSKFAAESQFYISECYMNMKKYYRAYLEYQKTIDKYPGSKKLRRY